MKNVLLSLISTPVLVFSLTGCSGAVQNFVRQAQHTDPTTPYISKDDAAPKISPAAVNAGGTQTRMRANFTVTNRQITATSGHNLRASITMSRASQSN